MQPQRTEARAGLESVAWLLSASPDKSLRNGPRALEITQELARLNSAPDPHLLMVQGAALAECGRFDDALAIARQAQAMLSRPELARQFQTLSEQIDSYQRKLPVRDPKLTNQPASSGIN